MSDSINRQDVLTYIDRVANSGMGKKKSLEYIRKYVEKADRKTEPQYDFGEYADRLWKIAYERGKREALEQTEPSCETCILKDTTEWCKRQDVCRAYQPKTENSSEKPNNSNERGSE